MPKTLRSDICFMSRGFFNTLREAPHDADLVSHKLLVRGGYMHRVGQGVFVYGPLLLKSMRKLEDIVREELETRGAQEVLMPMVQPARLWKQSGRWDQMDACLLRFKNRLRQDYCLGPTHEEVVSDYIKPGLKSWRDFPKTVYQIQTKYRDEIRPRFGLMRGREFLMKDAYSFDVSKADALKSYKRMFEAYAAIFGRLGVETRHVDADSGDIGGDYSQEFHVLAERGESELLVSTEPGGFAANVETCPNLRAGDAAPGGKGHVLKSVRGIEVGHVFYLGTKYARSMGVQFLDPKGQKCFAEMGCYGIGVTRTLQAVVEQSHDAKGIVWPKALAPYDVHVCLLDPESGLCQKVLKEFLAKAEAEGWSVLVDDRAANPGVKFKDADLLGLPLRVNLGERGLKNSQQNQQCEIILRSQQERYPCSADGLFDTALEQLKGAK